VSHEMECYYIVKGERHEIETVAVAGSIEELQQQLTHHLTKGDIQPGGFRVLMDFNGAIEIKLNPEVTITPIVVEQHKKADDPEDDIPF